MTTQIGKIVADFETQLSTVLSTGGTSATLQSVLDDDGNPLSSGTYFLTIDRLAATKEYIVATLTVTGSPGAYVGTLTNINSVSRQGIIGTTGAVEVHRVGATCGITDFADIQVLADIVRGGASLISSSPLYYDANFVPTVGQFQIAAWDYIKTYVDTVATNGAPDASVTVKGISQLTAAPARTIGIATISIASPAVITRTAHGLVLNNTVRFTTSGALPTGLSVGTIYYVIAAGLTSSTFQLATTQGGTAINTTGSQSGFHSLIDVTPRALGESDARLGTSSASNILLNDDNTSAGIDQSQITQDASTTVGMADSTTNQNKIAQSFTAGKSIIQGAVLNKQADTGTFTGTVTASVQSDSSGSPDGVTLGTVTLSNAAWLALPVGVFGCVFGSHPTLVRGTLYWLVVETSTADNSNHPNIGTSSTGGYASGSVKYKNVTDGWVAIATIDLYFETLIPVANQIAKYDASGLIPSAYTTDVGTTDAYSIVERGVVSYKSGQSFKIKVTTANTGPATVNVNNLGAKAIVKAVSTPLSTGDILAGQVITLTYDGTNFQMSSPVSTSGYQEFIFTANGTFTVPRGVTTVLVDIAGGGGGGGGGLNNSSSAGGGGGGEGSLDTVSSVTPLTQYSVVVGAGGSAGAGGGNGGNGGASSFNGISKAGGIGGQGTTSGQTGGAAGGASAGAGGNGNTGGGNGTAGSTGTGGGAGGAGGTGSSPNYAGGGGGGASGIGVTGGSGAVGALGSNGGAGGYGGAGGGGASNQGAGGIGGAGFVIIKVQISQYA